MSYLLDYPAVALLLPGLVSCPAAGTGPFLDKNPVAGTGRQDGPVPLPGLEPQCFHNLQSGDKKLLSSCTVAAIFHKRCDDLLPV